MNTRLYLLPWAPPWRRRCRAVLEPNWTGYHGRCELARGHSPNMEHALERGMEIVRWPSTPRIEPA